jgi:chromate reductase
MRVLAISGSLRSGSYNTALLREAARVAPDGVELELYEGLDRLPYYNEDHDNDAQPTEAYRLRSAIRDADAVLFATPEYNGTVPGHLKQVVDWGSRPRGDRAALWGKPVAVIGASGGQYGAMWAQDHLRRSLGIAGARVLDVELPVAKVAERFADDGRLVDTELEAQLADVLSVLAAQHERLLAAAA